MQKDLLQIAINKQRMSRGDYAAKIETPEQYQQRVERLIGVRPDQVGFPTFMMEFNARMNWATPDFHLELASWLYETGPHSPLHTDEPRRILQTYRYGGKRHTVSLYARWLLFRDPNFTIVNFSEDTDLAGRNALMIRSVMERFDWCQHLVPYKRSQWEKNKFNIVRSGAPMHYSVDSRGILGTFTGSHGHLIIADDIEGSRLADSDVSTRRVRDRLGEFAAVAPRHLFVGTPHREDSVYEALIDSSQNFKYIKRPVWKDELNRITQNPDVKIGDFYQDAKWVDMMQASMTEGMFKSQFLLIPSNLYSQTFSDQEVLKFSGSFRTIEPENRFINEGLPQDFITVDGKQVEIVEKQRFWDPAYARTHKDDNSVFAVVGRDSMNNVYVLEAKSLMPVNADFTFFTQCQEIVKLIQKYHLPKTTVEVASTNQSMANDLRKALKEVNMRCRVDTITRNVKKEKFISENLTPLIKQRQLYVHEDVISANRFMSELQKFGQNSKDDHIDAVAGAVALLKMPRNPVGDEYDRLSVGRFGQIRINTPKWKRR